MPLSDRAPSNHAPAGRRRVLLADDQRTFAELLRHALTSEADLHCVGLALAPDDAVEMAALHQPDVVLMDVRFVGDTLDGIDATARIRQLSPGTAVVLLTGQADASVLRRAERSGAAYLLLKNGSLTDLLEVVRQARPGRLIVHHTLRLALEASRPGKLPVPRLSVREHEVLTLLAIGMSVHAVSRQLGISAHTTRGYVKNLLVKLDAHSQLQAVAVARSLGLLDAELLVTG